VLAPTGTIGLMMDCDTTGIEPDLGLVKTKKLVGGGTMQIVNQTVPQALQHLGYTGEQVEAIVAYIDEHKTITDAPALRPEHEAVFHCAMGDDAIHYMGHVAMMAAAQPFISGAISKTVNLPEEATVEDVEQLHIDAWKLGIKAIAIYRDNCKVAQPLSVSKKADAAVEAAAPGRPAGGDDPRKLPKQRPSQTISFQVADAKGYLTAGEYPGDGLGEIFVKLGKQGSTLSGLLDAFAISVSLGLQYGVPLESLRRQVHEHALRAGRDDRRLGDPVRDLDRGLHRPQARDRVPAVRDPRVPRHLHARGAHRDGRGRRLRRPGRADRPDRRERGPVEGTAAVRGLQRPGRPRRPAVPDLRGQDEACRRCHVCESCGATSGCS
jgi:ribonucleoside-diphosphate reductase alpha chain